MLTNLLYTIYCIWLGLLYIIYLRFIFYTFTYSTHSLCTIYYIENSWRSKQISILHTLCSMHTNKKSTAYKHQTHYDSMPAVIQFRSHAHSNSVSSAFNTTDPAKIFEEKMVLPIESIFDKLALKFSLDLFWHQAHNIINLPENYGVQQYCQVSTHDSHQRSMHVSLACTHYCLQCFDTLQNFHRVFRVEANIPGLQ